MTKRTSDTPTSRRQFLGKVGIASAIATTWSTSQTGKTLARPAAPSIPRLPREVGIVTLSQDRVTARSIASRTSEVLARMEKAVALSPDFICLPELFYIEQMSPENLRLPKYCEEPIGEITRPFAEFARNHACYVVCPVLTAQRGRRYNSAVFLDREGELLGEYHKIHPTETEMEGGIAPGPSDPPVFQTEFGLVGAQICYDINWPEGWRKLHKAGAEIVFWPSAFPGGRMVNARAWENQCCVVTSIRKGVARVCDITGETLARTSNWDRWAYATVNLEKTIIPTWPGVKKFDDIRAKYGQDLRLKTFAEEGWTLFESRSPELKVADVLEEFDLKTKDQRLHAAEQAQSQRR